MCVCVRERERERESESVCVCVCVCVCVRERERALMCPDSPPMSAKSGVGRGGGRVIKFLSAEIFLLHRPTYVSCTCMCIASVYELSGSFLQTVFFTFCERPSKLLDYVVEFRVVNSKSFRKDALIGSFKVGKESVTLPPVSS